MAEKNNKNINDDERKVNGSQNADKKLTEKEHREKELQKLSEQLNNEKDEGRTQNFIRRVIIIILILLLLGGVGASIYFLGKGKGGVVNGSTIKLSMNADANLKYGAEQIPVSIIYPGDEFSYNCMVRNSDNAYGDSGIDNYAKIFIRYRLSVIVDDIVYNGIAKPKIPELNKGETWHIYDEDVETNEWDGFYYYYGSLSKNESLTLFSEIYFDEEEMGQDTFAGKSGKIEIYVEAVQALESNLGTGSGNAWTSAPLEWIENMQSHINQKGHHINF